mmetsp:Transcript_45382/g.131389  ORF Transcript_45382/g.131389 Transcript_45382/m.131389 type:complete len:174 (-) Transcript_45382:220-741(-)
MRICICTFLATGRSAVWTTQRSQVRRVGMQARRHAAMQACLGGGWPVGLHANAQACRPALQQQQPPQAPRTSCAGGTWDMQQPAVLLRELTLQAWAVPCSQGAAERGCASRGRKACPIRLQLKPTMVHALQTVGTKLRLFAVGRPSKEAPRMGRAMHMLFRSWAGTLANMANA